MMPRASMKLDRDNAVMLAIETSQRQGGVALRVQGMVHTERLQTQSRHDDDLLPAIDRLFSRCGIKPADLTHVAVSIGPGGFTGLRIATATAKMFAETLGVIIAAVPSALSAAFSYQGDGPIAVALASKNDTFWFSRLTRDHNGAWSIVGESQLADALTANMEGLKSLLADQFLPAAMVDRCMNAAIPIIEPQFTAGACLAAGWHLLELGIEADPISLNPLYARDPEAVFIWEGKKRGVKNEDSSRA